MPMKIHKLKDYSQRTFQFVKKHPIAFGFFFWLLLLTLPALLLDLSLQNMDYLAFLGAIIGGGIGGLFTLWGVLYTIQDQNEQKYIDSFPARDKALIEIIDVYDKVSKSIEKRTRVQDSDINTLRNAIGMAATVDGFTYLHTHDTVNSIESLYREYSNISQWDSNEIGDLIMIDNPRHRAIEADICQLLKAKRIVLFKHRDKMLKELMQKTGV